MFSKMHYVDKETVFLIRRRITVWNKYLIWCQVRGLKVLLTFYYGFRSWCKWFKKFDSLNTMPVSNYYISFDLVSLMQNMCSVTKTDETVYSIGWVRNITCFDKTFVSKTWRRGIKRNKCLTGRYRNIVVIKNYLNT